MNMAMRTVMSKTASTSQRMLLSGLISGESVAAVSRALMSE